MPKFPARWRGGTPQREEPDAPADGGRAPAFPEEPDDRLADALGDLAEAIGSWVLVRQLADGVRSRKPVTMAAELG